MKTLKPNVLSNGIWPVYQTGIYYSEGDIFKTSSTPTWGVWEVTTAGIGDLEPAGAIEGSVVTTGGITCKLTKLGSGSSGGSGVTIEDWTPSVEYKTGDFVIYINYLYRARRDNIKTAFDEADWQLIGSEAKTTANAPTWETRTNYVIGDLVEHDKNVFICLVSHVSNVFDMDNSAGYWKAVSSDITVVGGAGGYSQVTKMDVTATMNVNIDIAPNMPYCHPPVEVLKFEKGATSNVVENTFDVADETNFEFNNKFVKFDGTVGLRTKVTYPSNVKEVTSISPIYESDAINVSDYKTVLKIEV